MTTMLEQLEMMREKMRQMSESEMQLVRGLGEALNVADERLREQVRQFALEHNERRSVALAELRALSARLGALPKERFDSVRQSALPAESASQPRYEQPQSYQRASNYPPPAQQGYGAPQGYAQAQSYAPQQTSQPVAPRHEPRFEQPLQPQGASAPAAAATGDWRRAASRIEDEITHFQNMQRTRAR